MVEVCCLSMLANMPTAMYLSGGPALRNPQSREAESEISTGRARGQEERTQLLLSNLQLRILLHSLDTASTSCPTPVIIRFCFLNIMDIS